MNTKSAGGKQEKLEQPTDLTMDNYDISFVRCKAKKTKKLQIKFCYTVPPWQKSEQELKQDLSTLDHVFQFCF
jgi:hypothetical protein